jgi:hypothetical protein
MPVWTNVEITNKDDLKQFNIELNRRIRYYLSNIDVSQVLFNLNGIGGTLNLSKGGTGTAMIAPTSNALFGYDLSSAKGAFYGIGAGLALSGTTLYNTIFGVASTADFYKITATTANLADISSTNSATFNVLTSSSAQVGQLGSTGSITANTLTASSATFTKVRSSSAIFGNSTSYAKFEDDGTLEITGDGRTYRDELGDITKFKTVGLQITDDTTDGTVNYSTQCDLTSFQYTNVQLNHDRDLSGGVYPHIHWLQSGANAPNFLLSYRYLPNNSTIPTAWTYLKCNAVTATYVSGTLHQISYTTQAITPPANSTVSDILQFKIYRDITNASTMFGTTDNHTLPAKVLSFDAHIITNTLGSRTEYSK